jgi:hypothetical protein
MPNCISVDTLIPLWNGTIKQADKIVPGDQLIGDDGTVRNVLGVYSDESEMCQIYQTQGEMYTVTEDHILTLRFKNNIIDIDLRHFMECNSHIQDQLTGVRCINVQWPKQEVDSDPFLIGQTLVGTRQTNQKTDYIPRSYLINDTETRMALLEGILDSGMPIVPHTLAEDILFLARSLGFEAFTICKDDTTQVVLPHIHHIPLSRCTTFPSTGWLTVYEKSKEIGKEKYIGLHIDCNERFVLHDFTVTHS